MSALIVAVFCGVGLCLENPSVGNPVGSGTVPPTAYKSGLIPSTNPIDTSGNLVVTGNVANGMQFRGVVPYNSPTSFSAPASSLSAYIGRDGLISEELCRFAEFRDEQRGSDALLFTDVDGDDDAAGRERCGYDRRFGE